jgi:hypothetical protein
MMLIAAAVLTYVWHSFTTAPIQGGGAALDRAGHLVYGALAVGVLWLVARRIRRTPSPVSPGAGREPGQRVAVRWTAAPPAGSAAAKVTSPTPTKARYGQR